MFPIFQYLQQHARSLTAPAKGTKGYYSGENVFPFNSNTARFMWNTACDKAGCGDKDKRTERRIYHLHSLRKYFRTKIGLDLDLIHALMGHAEYLDKSYVRLDQDREVAEAYLEAMPNVSVYQVETPEIKSLEEENEELKARLARVELENTHLRRDVAELQQGIAKVTKMVEKLVN